MHCVCLDGQRCRCGAVTCATRPWVGRRTKKVRVFIGHVAHKVCTVRTVLSVSYDVLTVVQLFQIHIFRVTTQCSGYFLAFRWLMVPLIFTAQQSLFVDCLTLKKKALRSFETSRSVYSSVQNICSCSNTFIVQLMYTTLKNVGLLKHINIMEAAATCFGLQRNHHQGAVVTTVHQ